jgi:hypothetical protein
VSLTSERGSHSLGYNDNRLMASGVFVEKDFADIFTLKLAAGSAAGFSDPNTVFVGQSVAKALLLVTLLTVSLQSVKAATGNPVKSLRSE